MITLKRKKMVFSSYLPIELVEKICSYLKASDVLNLSAVNSFWRNALNSDVIWKIFCKKDFYVDTSEKPIIERPCRVRPAFQIPINESNILTSVCDWRIRYAQEVYVVNNWKEKRFHVENTQIEHVGHKYYIIGNFLLILDFNCNLLVYRIADEGFIPSDPIQLPLGTITEIYPIRTGFIATQGRIILYYSLKCDIFELKIRSLIDKAMLPNIPLIMDQSNLKEYCHDFVIQVNDRFLVACQLSCLYVWDLKGLSTFSYDFKDAILLVLLMKGSSPVLYIKRKDAILVLNLQKPISAKRFFALEPEERVQAVDDSLVLINGTKLRFIQDNGDVKVVQLPETKPIIHLETSRSLIFLFFKGFRMYSIDKDLFVYEWYRGSLEDEMDGFKKIISDLIGLSYSAAPYGSYITYVWDVRKSKLIFYPFDPAKDVSNSNKIILSGRKAYYFW